jgi:LysM repeat protein
MFGGQRIAREPSAGGDQRGAKLESRIAGIGKRNPATAIGIGGVLVVVVVALAKRGQGSGGGGTPSDQLQGTYDSTANDVYNSIESQLEALDQRIGDITRPPAAPPAARPPSLHPHPIPGVTYTAKKGDTLQSIAKRFGVSYKWLLHYNHKLGGGGGNKTLKTGARVSLPAH